MSVSKTKVVEYKGKNYSVEEFIEVVRNSSKEDLLKIVENSTYTKLVANYVKEHPECLEKPGATVATKK